MRATRGLLASLGASTSLVLATAVVLFSVSTIVAFRGWPGIDGSFASPGSQRIAVSDAGPGGGRAAARAQRVIVPHAPVARRERASAPRARNAAARAQAPVVVTRPRKAIRRHVPSSASSGPGASALPPAPAARPKASVPPAGGPVREVGTNLGGAAAGVAGGLGDTVRPVSPALGRTLDEAGRSLDQTIRGVTGVVGALLDNLLGDVTQG
jgi:hypothetical protein